MNDAVRAGIQSRLAIVGLGKSSAGRGNANVRDIDRPRAVVIQRDTLGCCRAWELTGKAEATGYQCHSVGCPGSCQCDGLRGATRVIVPEGHGSGSISRCGWPEGDRDRAV